MEQSSFQNFFKHSEPDELLPFLIGDNNKHPRFIHLLNVHLDITTQVDFCSECPTDAQFRIKINGQKKKLGGRRDNFHTSHSQPLLQ